MKKIKLIAIIIGVILVGSQSSSQEVISPTGGNAQAQGVQLNWTLGEPVIETIVSVEYTLTQGFHQTKLTVTSVSLFNENTNITAYPNPTSDIVFVKFTGDEFLKSKAELFTSDGKLLKILELNSEINQLNVKQLSNGEYFLRISKKGQVLRSFKIIKIF